MAGQQVSKESLYNSIHGNAHITQTLQAWLTKICVLCERAGMTNANIGNFFPSVRNQTEICGFVTINIDKLKNMIKYNKDVNTNVNTNVNQRVLLTTIYRFAKIFARLLWYTIYKTHLLPQNNTVNDFIDITGKVLDKDELMNHIQFVLQKHGIHKPHDDVFDELCKIFPATPDFLKRNDSHPSIITALTQPLGTDPVMSWMTYQRENAVRYVRNPDHNQPKIKQTTLTSYGASLCPLETEVLGVTGVDLPWNTGTMLYYVNPKSEFYMLAQHYKKNIVCGPSCTTQMMLDCALLFGIDVNVVLLALAPWMEIPQDHSLFEILLAANSYLTFDEYELKHAAANNDEYELNFLQNKLDEVTKIHPQSGGYKNKQVKINQKLKNDGLPRKNKKKMGGDGSKTSNALQQEPVIEEKSRKVEASTYYYKEEPRSLLADTWHPKFDYNKVQLSNSNSTQQFKLPDSTVHELEQFANNLRPSSAVPLSKGGGQR